MGTGTEMITENVTTKCDLPYWIWCDYSYHFISTAFPQRGKKKRTPVRPAITLSILSSNILSKNKNTIISKTPDIAVYSYLIATVTSSLSLNFLTLWKNLNNLWMRWRCVDWISLVDSPHVSCKQVIFIRWLEGWSVFTVNVILLNHTCIYKTFACPYPTKEADTSGAFTCVHEADGSQFCPPASVPPILWLPWPDSPAVPACWLCLPGPNYWGITKSRETDRKQRMETHMKCCTVIVCVRATMKFLNHDSYWTSSILLYKGS